MFSVQPVLGDKKLAPLTDSTIDPDHQKWKISRNNGHTLSL